MKNIVIDTSSVVVTLNCNLNCKLCNTGVPFRNNPAQFSVDLLKTSIQRYFSVVKYARKFSLTGGEPLLRADIGQLVEYIQTFKEQFDVLEIVTNGTIIPKQEILEVFGKYNENIFVLIDNYGDLSINAETLSSVLDNCGVKNLVRNYFGDDVYHNGWVDLTRFQKFNTPEQAKVVFNKCAVPNKLKKVSGIYNEVKRDVNTLYGVYTVLINGIVYRCMRPFLAVERGIEFDTTGQFVNLTDMGKTVEALNSELVSMFELEYPSICEYCPGMCDDSERFIPAEQA